MSAFGVPACTGDAPQGIAPIPFKVACSPKGCEGRVQIGVFFDGTGNNFEKDIDDLKHSNVARLWRAYPNSPSSGIYGLYIEGVGTPCRRVGEVKAHAFGGGFSAGGKARMCLGLIELFNSVYGHITNRGFILDNQALALCRSDLMSEYGVKSEDRAALASIEFNGVNLEQNKKGGLLNDGLRKQFIKKAVAEIKRVAKENDSLKLKEVVIDLFGFSRGAAEARAFQNWLLNDVFEGDTLFDVPAMIRFMGIFDTVASVGPQLGALGFVTGHMEWADSNLRISPQVKQCVHFVAMHENRNSFPLDSVRVGTSLPANCIEIAYPGMHSDVGGGYAPGEQGKPEVGVVWFVDEPNIGGALNNDGNFQDQFKLSQMSLNHMYEAAKMASVPLIGRSASSISKDFDMSYEITDFYKMCYEELPQKSRRLNEYLEDYLAIRLASARERLENEEAFVGEELPLPFFGFARGDDRFYLKKGLEHIWEEYLRGRQLGNLDVVKYPILFEKMKGTQYYYNLGVLINLFMHDSLAGFAKDLGFIEPTGYLHPRKVFAGDE